MTAPADITPDAEPDAPSEADIALAALVAAPNPYRRTLAWADLTAQLRDLTAAVWCEDHKRCLPASAMHQALRHTAHSPADVMWADAEQIAESGLPPIDDCWRTA